MVKGTKVVVMHGGLESPWAGTVIQGPHSYADEGGVWLLVADTAGRVEQVDVAWVTVVHS